MVTKTISQLTHTFQRFQLASTGQRLDNKRKPLRKVIFARELESRQKMPIGSLVVCASVTSLASGAISWNILVASVPPLVLQRGPPAWTAPTCKD
jgi:hypothetical protein